MKRLYVRPAFRGTGLGRRLAQEIIGIAAAAGYHTMRLITVRKLKAAVALYQALGFAEIPHYTNDLPPEPDVVSMELHLSAG